MFVKRLACIFKYRPEATCCAEPFLAVSMRTTQPKEACWNKKKEIANRPNEFLWARLTALGTFQGL